MTSPARPHSSPWRIGLNVALGLLALALGFMGWQYWLFKGGIFRISRFDAIEWRALQKKSDDFSCYRGGMANDIQMNVLRVGQTSNEVHGLLGRPDSVRDGVDGYFLGMCSGLRIDFDSLDIHFDNNNRLTLVQIVQH